MAEIERTIDVNLPLETVCEAWTRFDEFPHFMDGLQSVQSESDGRLLWVGECDGQLSEWHTSALERDRLSSVCWRGQEGWVPSVRIGFSTVGPERTRISYHAEYEPANPSEQVQDWAGALSHRIEGDLTRFRDYIEKAGQEAGVWRGGMGLQSTNQPARAA